MVLAQPKQSRSPSDKQRPVPSQVLLDSYYSYPLWIRKAAAIVLRY